MLVIEMGGRLVLEPEDVDQGRDEGQGRHVDDEPRHVVMFLEGLVDERGSATEAGVGEAIAEADTEGANLGREELGLH